MWGHSLRLLGMTTIFRKSKDVEIKFLVVKEKVQSGQMSIEHIGTNSIIVDPLTKTHS